MSLFDKYGGQQTIDKAVEEFYAKLLVDDTVKHFFQTLNMKKLMGHLKAFVAVAMGGPNKYSGRTMRAAHEHLNITENQFHVVKTTLLDTLEELGFEKEDLATVDEIVEDTKADITKIQKGGCLCC